jgi:hypothetical protein
MNDSEFINHRMVALDELDFTVKMIRELRDRAATVVRATTRPRKRSADRRRQQDLIVASPYGPETVDALIRLRREAIGRLTRVPGQTLLETLDLESALVDWFEEHGVRHGAGMASTFVQAGLDLGWLTKVANELACTIDSVVVEGALRWLHCTIDIELMTNEAQDSTERIRTLIAATKRHRQLGLCQYRAADVQ